MICFNWWRDNYKLEKNIIENLWFSKTFRSSLDSFVPPNSIIIEAICFSEYSVHGEKLGPVLLLSFGSSYNCASKKASFTLDVFHII